MSTILLSIKPEYANRIIDGTKKFEFRRRVSSKTVDRILIYSTSPVQQVIGEVEVVEVLKMKPSPLWEATKKEAGISRAKFRAYFSDCEEAYAYKLGKITKFDVPKTLMDYGIKQAPQSFVFIN